MRTLTGSLERVLALKLGDGLAVADAIALAIAARAMRGNPQALRVILDHCEGRPEPKSSLLEAQRAEDQRRISAALSKLSDDELLALLHRRQSEAAAELGRPIP